VNKKMEDVSTDVCCLIQVMDVFSVFNLNDCAVE
jgi:hypothetical protein